MTARARCWCGRPINDLRQDGCAEHDTPPPLPGRIMDTRTITRKAA